MASSRFVAVALAAFVALLVPAAAMAAPIASPTAPTGTAQLMRPLTLVKLKDMDFGWLGVTGAGTATIDPVANSLSSSGGVLSVGGTVQAAEFQGVTYSSAVVNIRIPNKSVTLTRVGGTETMTLDTFTLDGQSKRSLASAGIFTFRVGATLHPQAGQVEGLYTGTFDVTIQYP